MTILDQMSEYEISEGQAWAAQMADIQIIEQLALSLQFVDTNKSARWEVHFLRAELEKRGVSDPTI